MTPNAADRKSIRAAEKAARLAERQRAEVLTAVMSSRGGRAWLWDLLGSTQCFHTTFTGDALSGAFAEGRRSVGLALLADIMAYCPDLYIQAMREAHERSISDNRSPSDSVDPAAPAERRLGTEPDGGDFGALSDPDPTEVRDDPTEGGWRPGADIYA